MKNKFSYDFDLRKVPGFTLIEVMVTVAIVAILAAIVVPSYTYYIIRARIPDATSNLASKRVQMEQFFQDNHSYLDVGGANAPACNPDAPPNGSSQYFTFDCSGTHTGGNAVTATTYTIEAIGINSMAGFVYSIDQNNFKVTQQVPNVAWGVTPNTNNCWFTKKGGVC